MGKETFVSEILEEKQGFKIPKVLNPVLDYFDILGKNIITEEEVLGEIQNIDWNRHLEDLGLNFEEFKDKIVGENFPKEGLKIFLKKKEPHIQFAKKILEVYGFGKKYDLEKIEKINFSSLELLEGKLFGNMDINLFGNYDFHNNLIINGIKLENGTKWEKGNFIHINIGNDIVSFDPDNGKVFGRPNFAKKKNLKIYINGKKVITEDFEEKYFEYEEYGNRGAPSGGGINGTYYPNDNRGAKYIFQLENFKSDYSQGKIELEEIETLKYNMGTLFI